ncbi:Essential protein Yae1, N terminal [Xylographa soralifera]|nr:Essential protein Yae1, N terminal [Xylographa soralifera]
MLISTPPPTFPLPPPPTTPPQSDLLTDIFSSTPSPPHSPTPHTPPPHRTTRPPPSDIPRLRSQHSTAGYRDGLSASKPPALQPGFDESYPLGAVLGLQAGSLLGILDGVCSALKTQSNAQRSREGRSAARTASGDEGEKAAGLQIFGPESATSNDGACSAYSRLTHLRHQAAAELHLQRIFAAEYWGPDGLWRWAVGAPTPTEGREEVEDGGMEGVGEEVTFEDVAAAHPLLRKWRGVVEEVRREWVGWGGGGG